MNPRPSSTKVRRECFDREKWTDLVTGRIMLTCHICGMSIDPVRERWDAEHTSPHANGGTDVRPAHVACHRIKTSTQDVPAIAKGKRVRDRHFGITQSASIMPGSRRSRWKKKINGEVVER